MPYRLSHQLRSHVVENGRFVVRFRLLVLTHIICGSLTNFLLYFPIVLQIGINNLHEAEILDFLMRTLS